MTRHQPGEDTQEFRYSRTERYLTGVAAGTLWALLIVMAGFVASLAHAQEWVMALFLAAMCAFFVLLCRMVMRDFVMKNTWRVSLGPINAWFQLPIRRLLYAPAPRLTGPLAYSAIRGIEWREEAFRTMGMATINRVYAIRLKSGAVILLGEDRPIPKTLNYTNLAGNAARALASKAGVGIQQLEMAEGDGGVLTLWGTRRPDWPEGEAASQLRDEEIQNIRRNYLITQMVPVAAFAVMFLVYLLT